jgi:hypothetical protein
MYRHDLVGLPSIPTRPLNNQYTLALYCIYTLYREYKLYYIYLFMNLCIRVGGFSRFGITNDDDILSSSLSCVAFMFATGVHRAVVLWD